MSKSIGVYAKAVATAVVAALSAALLAEADGRIEMLEWVTIGSSFLAGLLAVWAVPEFPVSLGKYLKAITSGLIAGLASFSTIAVNGHLPTQAEWITIAVAVALGSGLVHVTKNAPESVTMHNEIVAPNQPSTEVAQVEPIEHDFVDSANEDEVK